MHLLFLLLGLLCSVLQAQEVSVTNKVTGIIGEEVILPCTFTNTDPYMRMTEIMWMHGSITLAVYSPVLGIHLRDPLRFQLVEPSQSSATLKISPVTYTDEGEYVCEVTTFPGGPVKATTTMVVKVLQAQEVSVTNKVTGIIGEEVTLPCTFTNMDPSLRVTQIMWMHGSITLAVYSPVLGIYLSDAMRFQLVEPSQSGATLKISPVTYTDEGEYVCEVITFPGGTFKGTTTMMVIAIPQNSAEANSSVVAGDQEQAVARCKSANGRPPSRITWHLSIPGNVSNSMINNSNGTYTVVSQYLITPTWLADGMTITCIINDEFTNDSIPLNLSVQLWMDLHSPPPFG
ncbi:nectin-1-like [Dendropsophus ebraccatus]|uniref:nectin-1-like n=1 Tax=Dendropsophus ebraccatus TaxID=150705 RepID=UPI0038316728